MEDRSISQRRGWLSLMTTVLLAHAYPVAAQVPTRIPSDPEAQIFNHPAGDGVGAEGGRAVQRRQAAIGQYADPGQGTVRSGGRGRPTALPGSAVRIEHAAAIVSKDRLYQADMSYMGFESIGDQKDAMVRVLELAIR